MAGILDILRAAVVPAAAARTGYLQGEETRRRRDAADEETRRDRARQTMQDQIGMQDRMRESREADETKKRQGVLDQSRLALEEAQRKEIAARTGAHTARGRHYDRSNPRGSGPNGELTPKDKARFMGARLQRYMTQDFDDFGDPVPGTGLSREAALIEAEKDWQAATGGMGTPKPTPKPSISGMREFTDPRLGQLTGAPTGPSAGPLAATRQAMTPQQPPAPAPLDSAALAKKYPFLFQQQ